MTQAKKDTLKKVVMAVYTSGGGGATASQIAALAGIKKSPYLTDLLKTAEKQKLISREVNPQSPAKGWLYKSTDKLNDAMKGQN